VEIDRIPDAKSRLTRSLAATPLCEREKGREREKERERQGSRLDHAGGSHARYARRENVFPDACIRRCFEPVRPPRLPDDVDASAFLNARAVLCYYNRTIIGTDARGRAPACVYARAHTKYTAHHGRACSFAMQRPAIKLAGPRAQADFSAAHAAIRSSRGKWMLPARPWNLNRFFGHSCDQSREMRLNRGIKMASGYIDDYRTFEFQKMECVQRAKVNPRRVVRSTI
jgi:hypothetical protein